MEGNDKVQSLESKKFKLDPSCVTRELGRTNLNPGDRVSSVLQQSWGVN